MKLMAIGSYITPRREKVSYVEYLKNPKSCGAMKLLERKWESDGALRIIADLENEVVYVFPYWVLHSDFIEDELGLDYSTLMDGRRYIFASIEPIPEGALPYSITESSQTVSLLKSFGDLFKTQSYLEKKLAWLRKFCIEPLKNLKFPTSVS